MRTIYIDSDYKCHIADDGTMTPVVTDSFDGCCDDYIEGCRYVPEGERWTRSDGEVFNGVMTSPWKDSAELDIIQRDYERERLDDAENALAILLGGDIQ